MGLAILIVRSKEALDIFVRRGGIAQQCQLVAFATDEFGERIAERVRGRVTPDGIVLRIGLGESFGCLRKTRETRGGESFCLLECHRRMLSRMGTRGRKFAVQRESEYLGRRETKDSRGADDEESQ